MSHLVRQLIAVYVLMAASIAFAHGGGGGGGHGGAGGHSGGGHSSEGHAGGGHHGYSPNDQRSMALNPNNAAYQAGMDNRANQLNPEHPAYWQSRSQGGDGETLGSGVAASYLGTPASGWSGGPSAPDGYLGSRRPAPDPALIRLLSSPSASGPDTTFYEQPSQAEKALKYASTAVGGVVLVALGAFVVLATFVRVRARKRGAR